MFELPWITPFFFLTSEFEITLISLFCKFTWFGSSRFCSSHPYLPFCLKECRCWWPHFGNGGKDHSQAGDLELLHNPFRPYSLVYKMQMIIIIPCVINVRIKQMHIMFLANCHCERNVNNSYHCHHLISRKFFCIWNLICTLQFIFTW